jgi:antirestriction protein ArdC
MNNPILDRITDSIIKELEAGIISWDKPFVCGLPMNYQTGKQYNGFNNLILGFSGFGNPYWLTFNQARQLGGKIKAGSKGTPIVYYNFQEVAKEDKKGDLQIKKIPFIRYSTVFNYEQTEGLKNKYIANQSIIQPIDEADRIIKAMPKAPEIGQGVQACYMPNSDRVEIPSKSAFKSTEGYYSVLFHELGHSTGHISRLGRHTKEQNHAFGSEDYSKEELVAEFTTCFLCGQTGILKHTQTNSTAYIQSWLKALKNDKSMLISAGSQAQKAYNYIMNIPTA